MNLNKKAYKKLVDGDIEWLNTMPDCLEKEHIKEVLKCSIEEFYKKN